MPPTIDATVNGATSNSYITRAEADAYWSSAPFNEAWENLDGSQKDALLIRATRFIEATFAPHRTRAMCANGCDYYYIISPTWTGAPATTTQALSWGRTGMTTRNGADIPSNVIPVEIKDMEAELAGAMAKEDRTADFDAGAQGISSVKAGPVSVSFKDSAPTSKIMTDAVMLMIQPQWLTDETTEYPTSAIFEVL